MFILGKQKKSSKVLFENFEFNFKFSKVVLDIVLRINVNIFFNVFLTVNEHDFNWPTFDVTSVNMVKTAIY